MSLTLDQVLSLAPDSASVKAGQSLATAGKWQKLGTDGQALWGECQGSGKNPYQTAVDLSGPAFKCSCPSHKFPCKHGLALLMLLVSQNNFFSGQTAPDWVQSWLSKRQAKSEPKDVKEVDPAEKAKRQAKTQAARLKNMQAGAEDLQLWLNDLITQGLAQVENQNRDYWTSMAKRMVDAKMPGAAAILNEIAELPRSENRSETVLTKLCELYLGTRSLKNLEKLPAERQQDVLSFLGVNLKRDEVLEKSTNKITDSWQVIGRSVEETQRNLRAQKIWLQGKESGKFALLLDYAYAGAAFDNSYLAGDLLRAELTYYPGNTLRVVVSGQESVQAAVPEAKFSNFSEFLQAYRQLFSLNPFTDSFPVSVLRVQARNSGNKVHFYDNQNHLLKTADHFDSVWHIISFTGGKPFSLFGEWDGEFVRPLTIVCEDKILTL